jgi:hypothetical protein
MVVKVESKEGIWNAAPCTRGRRNAGGPDAEK